jgi:nucleoside-diphosphate-sugar epimerase
MEHHVMAVLVTGSSGFLGRVIVARLTGAGHQAIGLDPAPPANRQVRHIADDLADAGRLRATLTAERITHIIHAGGVSGPMVLPDQPDCVMTINVMGTLNLLQAALETGVKTFIYCSSVSAIGDYFADEPIGEDFPMRPTTPYGCSKAAVDMVLRGLWQKVPLDLCSLRFTGIYGPGRKTAFVIGDIVEAAFAGASLRMPATSAWRYIYVDDAADAAVAACLSHRRRQLAYFIAHPQQVTLDELAAAASIAGPVKIEIDDAAPPLARGPLDIKPAMRDFDFAPKVDHREGIRRMIDWHRRRRAI